MAYQGMTYDIESVMQQFDISGLLDSLCSIQQPDGLLTASGAPSGTYIPVTGLQNIPCMNAPESTGSGFSVVENRTLPDIEAEAFRHVLLNAYYPQLSTANLPTYPGWRAVVDGVAYDLQGGENDSQFTMTRLRLRVVTV